MRPKTFKNVGSFNKYIVIPEHADEKRKEASLRLKHPSKIFTLLKKFIKLPFFFVRSAKRFKYRAFFVQLKKTSVFVILMFLLLFQLFTEKVEKSRYFPKKVGSLIILRLNKLLEKTINVLDRHPIGTIGKTSLIELSFRNMQVKKTRTMVTVGGMTIGIAVIVFLVSIGYGLQQLVISRVARLDELRQADVSTQIGSRIKINDKSLAEFKDIPNVTKVLPLISVVGRVNYQNSVSDMAVYGVTTEYLTQSAIKPISGKFFESNALANVLPVQSKLDQEVAGVSTQAISQSTGDTIDRVTFTIFPQEWIRVREGPSINAKIIGYTKRAEGIQSGDEVWGDYYGDNSVSATQASSSTKVKRLGKWIKSPVFIWEKTPCDVQKGDCENGQYKLTRDSSGYQVQKTGYFAEINIALQNAQMLSGVLGISTSASDSAIAAPQNNGSSIGFVEIASLSAKQQVQQIKTVALSSNAKREAVVNQAMLKVLGISENNAVGKTFKTTFVVTGDLLSDPSQKVQSEESSYTIVGVIPGNITPLFYVPFLDLRSLGISNYSQVKVVASDNGALNQIRRQIESKGYLTSSVADTVAQINSVFSTARAILALVGFVALAVASLGMFNTLTVSLLERTREVGLMKAMGMKAEEVKELFLTESMIMSFFGGILGLLLGFASGQLLGLFLSIFSVASGVGFINISYIPLSFIVVILVLSIIVGVITGIYPARRATKISALDALRYE